jgi:hypothetical protein
MKKIFRKIWKGACYTLYFLEGIKIWIHIKNIIGHPVIYDVFVTKKCKAVCVIAPYYSRGAFLKSVCLFGNKDNISGKSQNKLVNCSIIEDPEKGCLIVLFSLPEQMLDDKSFHIKISKGRRVFYEGIIENILGRFQKYKLSAGIIIYEPYYLAEWLDHNLRVGVEHIYVYDTNKEDERFRIKDIVEPYVKKGLATYIPWSPAYVSYYYGMKPFWPSNSHMYNQIPQIHHMIYKYAHDTEWILSCDVDEYFYSEKEKDLKKIIELYPDAVALEASGIWLGGTTEEVRNVSSKGVVASFLRSEPFPTSPTKLILRTMAVITTSIHTILEGPQATPVPPDILVFNHYRAFGWRKRIDEGFARQVENKTLLELQ